jgi:uncharacterized protein YutD
MHFRTEPIEQPPWGIDQQRLKKYAERVMEMNQRMAELKDHASHYKSINSEYFPTKMPKRKKEKGKSKSKGKSAREYELLQR